MCAEDADRAAEPLVTQAELRERLAGKSVAILGCGGLGSNCAVMLVRSGLTNLTLVDNDVVSAENLNRQHFFLDQVGMRKVDALADTLRRVDPAVELSVFDETVDEGSLSRLVAGTDAIIEAVDVAETKAMIVSCCSRDLPAVPLACASGLAGLGSANAITTLGLGENVWVAGDLVTDIREGHALVASRVMLAAAHQTHAVIRELLGLEGA